jgi:thiamine biosynthesis lipoprotein
LEFRSRKNLSRLFFFFAAILLLVKIIRDREKEMVLNQITGQTMGTIPYNIKYLTLGEKDFKSSVDSLLVAFNQSLSTYIPGSEISRFNRSDTIVFESDFFYPVLERSRMVHQKTYGAFDPTVGPLVNAWGFGPDKQPVLPDSLKIDSLVRLVGFGKISYDSYYAVKPKGMYLDLSAVAKGYAIDRVAVLLESRGVERYMVEIGGEVRAKGNNEKSKPWTIGIEDPIVDRSEQKIMAILRLKDRSVATSGNYRNYYLKDDRLFAHIIDPRSGYTSQKDILSASVIAKDCMTADAFATAFMVMGVDSALQIVNNSQYLDAILVRQTEDGPEVLVSEGIEEHVNIVGRNDGD